MTLFREINSLLFGLFLLVMTSLVYFQFTQTRDFMSNQMESDLNNTITSLGLMLKPHIESGDVATAETLVNVIFEGGFYQKVTLTWLANDKVQVWENPLVIQGVPKWFIKLDLFEQQKKHSLITSGWMQLATLEVEGHPALGYRELWRVMNDTVMVLSILFLLSIFVLRFRLNRILKPLNDIATQAKNIAQRQFDKDIDLPKTSELKDVVTAINFMSGQLKKMFASLYEEVNLLKDDKLIDSVSGLPNREYLSAQINNWLNEPGIGGLILAKFDWLDDIHSKYGYQGRDELIKALSARLQTELPTVADGIIARISNIEFAFLVKKAEQPKIEKYLQSLILIINQEISNAGCTPNTRFTLGISQRIENMKSSDLMSQSDNALQQAKKEKKISYWIDSHQSQKYSRAQWRSKLEDSIQNNHFVFQWQPVISTKTFAVIQREIYCRLSIDGQVIKASEFMPFVELLSLGAQLDKCLIQSIEQQNILSLAEQGVAINLTHDSVQDSEFTLWLTHFLKQTPFAKRILFEIPESAVMNSFDQCFKLAQVIRGAGAKIGIDQCGRQLGSIEYLQRLQPHYIKLDQSFAYYEKFNRNKELCRALVNVAKGLNIDVIITGIEDEFQLAHFELLKADGYQGYISPVIDL